MTGCETTLGVAGPVERLQGGQFNDRSPVEALEGTPTSPVNDEKNREDGEERRRQILDDMLGEAEAPFWPVEWEW